MVTALRQIAEPAGTLQVLNRASQNPSDPDNMYFEFLTLARSVLDNTHDMRSLQREIDRAVAVYVPLKLSIVGEVTHVTGEQDVEKLQQLINQEILNALDSSQQRLSNSDKVLLLDSFRMSIRLSTLANDALIDSSAFNSALQQCFWELQKLDFTISIVVLAALSELNCTLEKLHWLCLSVASYQQKVESAFFAHNPILQERIKTTANLLATKEMERRLGILG